MPQDTLSRRLGPDNRSTLSPAAALVRGHDRDRFQTALFAPAADRETLFALYAFNYEIARVRETVTEPMLGQIRLQWWRDAIDAAFAGGPPRRHDIVEAVTTAIRGRGLSRAHFARLIDTREHDLDAEAPPTLAALEAYADGTSTPLVLLALEALGAMTPAAERVARPIGIAYALAGLLRSLPYQARSGRVLVPAELGLEPRDWRALSGTPPLREAVATIAGLAMQHLAAARTMRREIPATAIPALLPARIATTALRRLERAGFDPFAMADSRQDALQPWRLAVAALLRRF
jgi:phytoene synthase